MVDIEGPALETEALKKMMLDFMEKYAEYYKTFDGGDPLTAKEELKLHEMLIKNMEKALSADEDIVPSNVTKYGVACSPGNVMVRMSLGNNQVEVSEERIGGVFQEHVGRESLTHDKMYEYFEKISKKTEIPIPATVKESISKAIPQKIKDNAKMAAQLAFYGTMFFGVHDLFGATQNFLGDFGVQLPFKPDIIVGTLPFYSAQRLERGMSDRILKYRAIGDVFLAHQRGGTDTLRVDMTLFGPYRGWYLLYLLALQQGGETVLKELPLNITESPIAGEQITIPKEGKLQYETHMTFPVITQTAIMLDMYLQTIEWHQEVDKGGNSVIYVHLLLRKHIEPQGVNVTSKDAKVGILSYGDTLHERKRKELIYDTLWKVKEIGMEVLKIGLFGASNMIELDMEAVTSDPYITDIAKLLGGYSYDINNMASIIPELGG